MIRIAIVDDQHLSRQSLCALIKGIDVFELVADADNGLEFLEKILHLAMPPDIALVAMDMPDMNGIELTDCLHRNYPGIKVIAMTVVNQQRYIPKMIETGASAYLVKNCTAAELITTIESIYKTGFYFNAVVLSSIQRSLQQKELVIRNVNNIPIDISDREREVLELICGELTNAEIGARLHLSVRTVEGHRNSLLAKTGCRNTAGLVVFAIRHGIFQIGV